jgi:hypothetical protein
MNFPKITHVKSNSPNTVQIIDRTNIPTSAAKNINNFMHYLSQQKYSTINPNILTVNKN